MDSTLQRLRAVCAATAGCLSELPIEKVSQFVRVKPTNLDK